MGSACVQAHRQLTPHAVPVVVIALGGVAAGVALPIRNPPAYALARVAQV